MTCCAAARRASAFPCDAFVRGNADTPPIARHNGSDARRVRPTARATGSRHSAQADCCTRRRDGASQPVRTRSCTRCDTSPGCAPMRRVSRAARRARQRHTSCTSNCAEHIESRALLRLAPGCHGHKVRTAWPLLLLPPSSKTLPPTRLYPSKLTRCRASDGRRRIS